MTKLIGSLFLICLLMQSTESATVSARFIAVDKLQALTNPREPMQQLIATVESDGRFRRGTLLRIIYFPQSTSLRGGARFLDSETLNYSSPWRLKLRSPQRGTETGGCADFDNFIRIGNKVIDEDEKQEPLLRFRSTQFQADLKFDNLSAMPCFVLESLSKID